MYKGSEGYKCVSDFLQLDSTQEYGTALTLKLLTGHVKPV